MYIEYAKSYSNGNYNVVIFKDGTKVRYNDEDSLVPDFPECVDLKITDKCNLKCPMCHESSVCNGRHADLQDCMDFVSSMHPYTEVAIGGGNPMCYPGLKNLLIECSNANVIPNMTVNIEHLKDPHTWFKVADYLTNDLLNSVGVSVPFWYNKRQLRILKDDKFMTPGFKASTVLHMIIGLNTVKQMKELYGKGFKLLLLGYKTKGRGKELREKSKDAEKIDKNTLELMNNLEEVIKGFNVVSFDNLAIKQLGIGQFCKERNLDFSKIYMGDDGDYTMYVDMVRREYAISSTNETRYSIETMDATEIFKSVQNIKKNRQILEE